MDNRVILTNKIVEAKMALRTKLLDEKVVNLAKEILKKVRNNVYVSRKLQAVIAAKKSSIMAVARVCKISRTALTEWIKHLKFGRAERLFAPPERISVESGIKRR